MPISTNKARNVLRGANPLRLETGSSPGGSCGCKAGAGKVSGGGCGCSYCSAPIEGMFARSQRQLVQAPAFLSDKCMTVREKPADYYLVPADSLFVHIAEAVSQGAGSGLAASMSAQPPLQAILAEVVGQTRFVPGFIVEVSTGADQEPGSITFDIDWIDGITGESRNSGQYIVEQDTPGRARIVVYTFVPASAGALNAFPRLAKLANDAELAVVPVDAFGQNIPAVVTTINAPDATAVLNVSDASTDVGVRFRTLSPNDQMWEAAMAALRSSKVAA